MPKFYLVFDGSDNDVKSFNANECNGYLGIKKLVANVKYLLTNGFRKPIRQIFIVYRSDNLSNTFYTTSETGYE